MDALEDAVSDPETRNNQLIAALFNLRGRDIPEEEIEAMSPKALTLEIFNLLVPAQTRTEFWRTTKLTGKEQEAYIRERFPDWKGPEGGAE